MKIHKRRDKLGKSIPVRVPDAIKTELDHLREHADPAGFDAWYDGLNFRPIKNASVKVYTLVGLNVAQLASFL